MGVYLIRGRSGISFAYRVTNQLSIYPPYDANFAALLGGNAGNWLHRLRVGAPRLETPLAYWGLVGNMGICEIGERERE